MNCADFDRVFYADLAGDSAAEVRAAADCHAAGCATCARKLAQQASLAAAMGVDVPRIRRARRASRARRRSAAVAVALVCAAFAIAVQGGAWPRIVAFAARRPPPSVEPTPSATPYTTPEGARGAPIAAESLERAREDATARALEEALAASMPMPKGGVVAGSFEEAMLLYRSGRFKAATVAFQTATPPSPESAMWAARSLRASGDFAGAALLFAEVAAGYSRSSLGDDAILEAGRCYRALGQVDKARDWLRPLRATPTHAVRAQEELEGIERDLAEARKRAKKAREPAPEPARVVAPRGIDPTPRAWPSLW